MIDFIHLRGDFNIMSLLPDKATSGVFELLENACLELSQISYQVGRRTSATSSQRLQLYPGFLHGRMMWSEWGGYVVAVLCWSCDAVM